MVSLANSTGSTIDGSSFSGLLTRVEIGHIRIRSAGNGRIRLRGSGSSLNHRVYTVMDFGHQLIRVGCDDREGSDPLA
jgi:hypothetical protein